MKYFDDESSKLIAQPSGTAASAYHLSGTVDWSSLASQIKNQTIIICSPVEQILPSDHRVHPAAGTDKN